MRLARSLARRRDAEQKRRARERREREQDIWQPPRAGHGERAGNERRGEEREVARGRVCAERDAAARERERLSDESGGGSVI